MQAKSSYKQTLRNYLFKLKLSQPFGGLPINLYEPIKPFFIIGSGRCGTTLLRRILCAHPDCCIPPETYVLAKCIDLYRKYNNLPWKDLVYLVLSTLEYHPKFVAFGISLRPLAEQLTKAPESKRSLAFILDQFYHYYALENNDTCIRWGDKTPKNTFHLSSIHDVFPNAQYIHLIRHGFDVVHSYIRTGLHQNLSHSAKQWKRAVKSAQSFGEQYPSSYLEIRYEALVTNPHKTIRKVCGFLDIGFFEDMVDESQAVATQMGDVPAFEHFSSVFEPVSTKKIGQGRDSFSDAQIKDLKQLIGKELCELGYEI